MPKSYGCQLESRHNVQPDIPTGNILTLWVDLVSYFTQSFGKTHMSWGYVFFSILYIMWPYTKMIEDDFIRNRHCQLLNLSSASALTIWMNFIGGMEIFRLELYKIKKKKKRKLEKKYTNLQIVLLLNICLQASKHITRTSILTAQHLTFGHL